MKDFANLWQKHMKVSAVRFVQLGIKISKIRNIDSRKAAMQKFLRSSFNLLTLYLWKVIRESIADYGSDVEKLKDQELAVRRSTIINEAMQNWINGIADSLAAAIVLNIDILDNIGEETFKDLVAETSKNLQDLEKFIGST